MFIFRGRIAYLIDGNIIAVNGAIAESGSQINCHIDIDRAICGAAAGHFCCCCGCRRRRGGRRHQREIVLPINRTKFDFHIEHISTLYLRRNNQRTKSFKKTFFFKMCPIHRTWNMECNAFSAVKGHQTAKIIICRITKQTQMPTESDTMSSLVVAHALPCSKREWLQMYVQFSFSGRAVPLFYVVRNWTHGRK